MTQIYGKEVSFNEGKNSGAHILALLKVIAETVSGGSISTSPVTVKTVLTPVTNVDIGADYKEGSQGQVKEIYEYDTLGVLLKKTVLKYQNSEYPEFMTEAEEM